MNDGFLGILRLAFVALQNISFAVVVGVLLSDRWLARRSSVWQAGVSRRLLGALRVASFGALISSAFVFWIHCALMSDSTLLEAGPAIRSMLVETAFGHAWLVGASLMLFVAILSLIQPGKSIRFSVLFWLALAGVALARSNGGHPVDAGLFSLPVWADWVHLLAVSAWVGLVLVTTYLVVPRFLGAPSGEHVNSAEFVRSLSDAATFALIALFLTGAYNGWRGLNTPGNLLESAYGQILLLKLALVSVAAALGAHNRFFEMPRLLSSLRYASSESPMRPLKRFSAVLHVESLVLAGVLVSAAVLVSSPLPGTA
ncbi:copper resistance D domain-containing protein [Pandoraea terrae]|uniref:Copper resistance D domain-containing protein n=1 Tax=Pandoraea terrae TaxID=1537710 RepID=A0A5E4V1R7_9BURK|nr:CopD family protein [Pandoraea terrae]VVE06061.1 copper resistance D domain-containing protein [Pandoraea terrae]